MFKMNIFYAVERESNSAYIEMLRDISMYKNVYKKSY